MTENFLKLVSDTKPEIQEAQRIPRTINAKKKQKNKKTISKHIIFKLQKIKDKKVLTETRRKKHLTYRGTEITIMSYFSETMQIRKEWGEIFNVLRKKPPIQNSIPYEIVL